ncbi:MAG: transposase [Tannerellaceae bacterium]|jgi:hypothetical protein|nr:transposase [Tannerellaceae bacterium]
MNVKIEEISELSNLLRNKNQISSDLSGLFHLFGVGRILRHYRLEKEKGISVYSLILALCLFRIRGESIHMAWRKGFHGWFTAGKNSFYRLLCCEKIHWRKLLLGVGKGFLRIVREQGGEGAGSPRCFILDDTTFEKTGMHLEGISRVFDHVILHAARFCALSTSKS